MISFSHHLVGDSRAVMALGQAHDVNAQEQAVAEQERSIIAQEPNGRSLEKALEPRFSTESTGSVFWHHARPYVGPTLLSLLILGFLIFLLFQRRLKEARLAVFATVLLGFALPIWLSVKFTLDSLNVEQPTSQVTPTSPSSESASPPAIPSQSSTTPESDSEEESASSSVAAIGLRNLELDFEFEPSAAWLPDLEQDALADLEGEVDSDSTALADLEDGTGGDATATDDVATPVTPATITAWEATEETISPTQRPKANLNSRPVTAAPSPPSAPPKRRITTTANTATGGTAPVPPRLRAVNFDAPIAFRAVLRQGLIGRDVIVLQKLLQDLGLYEAEPDGYFGVQTAIAVQAFQKQHNLLDDGIVGFSTCEILNAQVSDVELECRE